MQKTIKPWAEDDGIKTAPEREYWDSLDQPAAEDWNYIQHARDTQLVKDAHARAIREFGVNPARLSGNQGNLIPVFRPNAFQGADRLWDPENGYNKPASIGSQICDACLGWDPALEMPVLVYATAGSGSATSKTLQFVHCWDYENSPVTKTERTITFSVSMDFAAGICLPILVCDGYLYVITRKSLGLSHRISRYSLLEWTGDPDATLDISAYANIPSLFCTEMVELDYRDEMSPETWEYGHIGFFAKYAGGVIFCRFRKDLGLFLSSTTPAEGVDTLDRVCRTDGEAVYTVGNSAENYCQLIGCRASQVGTPFVGLTNSATTEKIVDIFPLQPGPDDPAPSTGVACLMHKSSAPYGPYIKAATMPCEELGFAETYILYGDDLQFDWTKPGCFVAMGAQLFAVLVRMQDALEYTQLVKLDPTYFLTLDGTAPACTASNSGPFVGTALQGEYSPGELTVRAFHDGRSIWVVDMQYSTCRRVVAPGR